MPITLNKVGLRFLGLCQHLIGNFQVHSTLIQSMIQVKKLCILHGKQY